eukprot:TRINITY_DN3137_c0_g1_i1.p1 TRINITY_DN3137_c0_g1~~TRINITY_DN3137_c0_g1_i1.p1  ORF type:complete len:425 (+),score=113.32 TRINITY_DN3137_c0_g1_i1:34-1275(+)
MSQEFDICNWFNVHSDQTIRNVVTLPNQQFATGSFDKTVKIWNFNGDNIDLISTLEGHSDSIYALFYVKPCTVYPNGVLISGSADSTIIIWDLETYNPIQQLIGHTQLVSSLTFDYKTQCIVSTSWDGSVKFWFMETGDLYEFKKINEPSGIQVITIQDGLVAAAGGHQIHFFEIVEPKEVIHINTIQFSKQPNPAVNVVRAIYAPENFKFSNNKEGLIVAFNSGSMALVDPIEGRIKKQIKAHDTYIYDFCIYDSFLFSIAEDGTLGCLLLEEMQFYGPLNLCHTPWSIAMLDDGETLVVVGENGFVTIFNKGDCVATDERKEEYAVLVEAYMMSRISGDEKANDLSGEIDGKKYDFVISVQLGEKSVPLGFNKGDNAYQVAELWCMNNNIDLQYKEQIVHYLYDNIPCLKS